MKFGNPLSAEGGVWRGMFHPVYESLFGQTVVSARVDVWEYDPESQASHWADLYHASQYAFDSIDTVAGQLAHTTVGTAGSFTDARLTAYLQKLLTQRIGGAYFLIVGNETPGVFTYKRMNVKMLITYGQPPSGHHAGRLAACGPQCGDVHEADAVGGAGDRPRE